MINVNEIKQYAEFLAKKWQSGAILAPDQFNLVLPNVVRSIVRKYYGIPEQYMAGMPMPPISADETQLVRDYLATLKETTELIVPNTGIAKLPANYIHKSRAVYLKQTTTPVNMVELKASQPDDDCDCDDDNPTIQGAPPRKNITTTTTHPVRFRSDEQFDWDCNSSLHQPSLEYPIAKMVASGDSNQPIAIEFAPRDIGKVEFTYYRYPLTPVWGYTTAGGFATYNPATSTNVELPLICAEEVVFSCLQRLGISIREPMLINWADKQRQMGQ